MSLIQFVTRRSPAWLLGLLHRSGAYLCHHRLSAVTICRLIPAQCPFERDVYFGGWYIHVPPMCKLNPLYEVFVYLRFHSLCFLEDHKEEFHLNLKRYY